ncbi:MAG: hypothetical protein AAF960_17075, partial [Bacteroidota bacterium]
MRKALILGIGFLFSLLFIIPGRYTYVCLIQNNCGTTIATDAAVPSLKMMDGDSAILNGYEQLTYGLGSIAPDLSLDNEAFLDKVAAYMLANPEKNLTITGRYRPSEEGKSFGMYENLGIARANLIRDYLIKRGIPIERMSLDHEAATSDDLSVPVKFNLFVPRPEDYSEDGGLVKTQFRFDNMTFSDANFAFNSAEFKPGSAFNVWADSVITFFDLNEDKSLRIIGHTDNIGTVVYNEDLGLRRAQSAKSF